MFRPRLWSQLSKTKWLPDCGRAIILAFPYPRWIWMFPRVLCLEARLVIYNTIIICTHNYA